MTPDDLELDSGVFGGPELRLFRIAKAIYANLSGVGAASSPGRWNHFGQEALYTAVDVSTAVLEKLVHTPPGTVPTNQALMRITLRGDWDRNSRGFVDRQLGTRFHVYKSLDDARTSMPGIRVDEVVALAVPSVIAPAWNVVLFPGQSRFWKHVLLESVDPWQYDPRLFSAPPPVTS